MADAGIHVFRVSLRPKLYRDIEIASDDMLSDRPCQSFGHSASISIIRTVSIAC